MKNRTSQDKMVGRYSMLFTPWLGSNNADATTSEAEAVLQTLAYDDMKKAWN